MKEEKNISQTIKIYMQSLLINFGTLYVTINLLSLLVDLQSEPFGGFLGQTIFVFIITSINFIFKNQRAIK